MLRDVRIFEREEERERKGRKKEGKKEKKRRETLLKIFFLFFFAFHGFVLEENLKRVTRLLDFRVVSIPYCFPQILHDALLVRGSLFSEFDLYILEINPLNH